MAFSDNTLKILMRLSYLDCSRSLEDAFTAGQVISFETAFNDMLKVPTNAVQPQMFFARKLAPVVGNHDELLRLEFLGQVTDRKGGFSASAFRDIDGERALVYRGTNSPADIIDDWQMSVKGSTKQKLETILFFDVYGQPDGHPIRLAGHSLGGGLVAYLFMLVAEDRDDVDALVINSAYFPDPEISQSVGILADRRFRSECDVHDGLWLFYQIMADEANHERLSRPLQSFAQAIGVPSYAELVEQKKTELLDSFTVISQVHWEYLQKAITDCGAANYLRGHTTIQCDI